MLYTRASSFVVTLTAGKKIIFCAHTECLFPRIHVTIFYIAE